MKKPELLGARAIELGFATQEQVAGALARQVERKTQGKPHMPLGLLLVEAGSLTSGQLATLLGRDTGGTLQLEEDAVRLAARLHATLGGEHRMILTAGAREQAGASTVATQVALALALMDEGNVLLVDANLRSPSLHTRFSRSQSPGFSEVVQGKVELASAAVGTGVAGLDLLPSGRCDLDFVRLLLSEESGQLLRTLRAKYRLTIIDAPPILPAPETATLAARSDGVVAVLAEGRARRSDALEVQRLLDGLKTRLLGVVLTRAPRDSKRARSNGEVR